MDPTLLIIDDDEKLNNLLKNYLKGFGFRIIAATHPEDGLKQLRDQSPDLIILDVMLPGMDGFEVCKTIRKTHTVPILMLTGDDSDANLQNSKVHKVASFIVKPAGADSLRRQMLHALGLQPIGDADTP